MRNPTLTLKHPEASRERLLAYAHEVPGAYVGIKIAALLLTQEGQRPGWTTRVLGLTRQSLNIWMHRVNDEGLKGLEAKPKCGRPTRLKPKIRSQLKAHLEKSPSDFGLKKEQWDGPTLVVHLKKTFGICLKVRQAQYWMRRLTKHGLERSGQSRGRD